MDNDDAIMLALGIMKALPDNAASSAAAAAASAQEAQEAADSVSSATVAEIKTYFNIA